MTSVESPQAEFAEGPTVTVDGLRTYLACPRRYEFAHSYELEADEEQSVRTDRLELLRATVCDGLRTGVTDPDTLTERLLERLATRWRTHDERFHSLAQRRHERRVLEATIRAYVDTVGVDHARGLEAARSAASDYGIVGPDLPLSMNVPVAERENGRGDDWRSAETRKGERDETADNTERGTTDTTMARLESTVDYVYVGSQSTSQPQSAAQSQALVGVRFVPTARPLGLLRYRSSWAGDVAATFEEHFDPGSDRVHQDVVGVLLETAAVLGGLRRLGKHLGFEDLRCRYVQIPLVDPAHVEVNWVRGDVDVAVDPIDLTDPFVDEHTYAMTHEHRNRAVNARLRETVSDLVGGAFEPGDRWEEIAEHCCSSCGYSVCCQEYLSSEVRFDG